MTDEQAEIWCTVHNLKASKAGEVEPWLRGLMLQLYYIPLFLAGFAGAFIHRDPETASR